MKNKRKVATIVLAVLTVVALAVGSLALFTDRFQSEVILTAGTLDLVLEQNWEGDNAVVAETFKPGTGIKLNYTLRNGGNMAANVKEKFVISTDKALTASAPEFALYAASDVDVAADGSVTIHDGATPIVNNFEQYTVSGDAWYKFTYEIPQFVLDGSLEKVSGVNAQSKTGAFVVVFSENATNDFQAAKLKVEYLAQGLQYGNTGADTWNDDNVVTATVTIGGVEEAVVPELVPVSPGS